MSFNDNNLISANNPIRGNNIPWFACRMYNQFTDLSIPDPSKKYYYAPGNLSTNFTHLMKLVICINKFTEAFDKIKDLLIDCQVNINAKNDDGITALMIASINSSIHSNNDTVRLLIEHGANVNIQANNGATALYHACNHSHNSSDFETVKLLLDNGANPNVNNNRGLTPLFILSMFATLLTLKVIDLLLDYGADATQIINMSHNNTTALITLCHNHKFNQDDVETLMKLIIYSGRVLNHCNINGKTAYDYYIDNDNNVLNEHQLRILNGTVTFNNTKSSRNA